MGESGPAVKAAIWASVLTLLIAGFAALSAWGSLNISSQVSTSRPDEGASPRETRDASAKEEKPEEPSEEPSASPDPTPAYAPELLKDIDFATNVVDAFWARHWSDYFTGEYRSPQIVGIYDGLGADVPSCAGESLAAFNAYYCHPGDFVAWDISLMEEGYAKGDAWPYLVIAHEWGHAIQARLEETLTSEASELQADCLAAATLYGSAQDGEMIFEAGDQKEIVNGLTSISDELPWTSPADHGDPFDRVDAFDTGRRGGVDACFPDTAEGPQGAVEDVPEPQTGTFDAGAEYASGVTVWVRPIGFRAVSDDAAGAVDGQAAMFEMTVENHSGKDLDASHMSQPAVSYYESDRLPASPVTDVSSSLGFDFLGIIPAGTTRTGEFGAGIPFSGTARVRVDVPGPEKSDHPATFEGCFC